MNTENEAAKVRLTREYETCIDELTAGVDPENFYTTLDGERIDEYTLLGRLLAQSGVAWVCLDRGCRCINSHREGACTNCGKRKPKARDIPKADSWA